MYEYEGHEDTDLDQADLALKRYFEDNHPITSKEILNTLHSRYGGDDEVVTRYRGLLFSSKQQLERFNEATGTGIYQHGLPSAFSADKRMASQFSHTQKTYNDMSMARASSEGLKHGEIVSGYEGALLEVEFNAKDAIDLSKAGFSCESELLLLPSSKAKIVSIERKIPLSRQFEEGLISIDECINDASNRTSEINYITYNFVDDLTPEQITKLCRDSEKRAIDREDSSLNSEKSKELLKTANQTGQIQIETREERRERERINGQETEPFRSHQYFHPNGIVLREFKKDNIEHTPSGAKWETQNTLTVINETSGLMLSLAEEGVVNMDKTPELLRELNQKCNSICQAIADISELPEFEPVEIHWHDLEMIRNFASPLMLEVAISAISKNVGNELNELESTVKNVATKDDVRQFTYDTEKEMANLLKSIASKRPSTSNPFR